MRVAIMVGVLLLGCQAAVAAAYDDFAQGIAANHQGNSDLAIKSFTAAIAAPDLNPTQLPEAYRGRAEAYLSQGKCQPAVADLDAALKINPADLASLALRGQARACEGDFADAEADFSTAIAVKPVPTFYHDRAWVRFRAENFSGAADDFARPGAERQPAPIRILWLELSRYRAGTLDAKTAAKEVGDLDLDDWPAPLLNLYAGQATPDAALAAAKPGEGHQLCEADFFVAEWHLGGAGGAEAARPLFEKAVAACPTTSTDFHESRAELGRMK